MYTLAYSHKELQHLYNKSPVKPQWFNGNLLSVSLYARDPLTYNAYFDALDLTVLTRGQFAENARSKARYALGSHYTLNIHAEMVKVKANWNIAAQSKMSLPDNKRGEIIGFSRASRKRLIELMASVRYDNQLLFATYTYPDNFPPNPEIWRQHFEAYRRRFERRYPSWRAIWRMELKERKSGSNRGQIAPHYHIMVFTDAIGKPDIRIDYLYRNGKTQEKTTSPISRSFEQWSQLAWSQIVNSGDTKHEKHGAFVVAVRNRRHAMKYVSKYVAKEDNDNLLVGRRWGRIGTFDTASSNSITLSRNQYIEFKRTIRKILKARGSDYHKSIARSSSMKGITVFGIGDYLQADYDNWYNNQLIYTVLRHVADITNEPIYTLEKLE